MFEHLQYKAAVVTFKTPAGRQANKILDFNDDASIKYREFVLDLIAAKERDRRETEELLLKVDLRIAQFPRRQDLKDEKDLLEQDLAKTNEHMLMLCGAGT